MGHSPSFIAAVALAAHAGNESISTIAKSHALSEDLVLQWRDQLIARAARVFAAPLPDDVPINVPQQQPVLELAYDMVDVCLALLGGTELRFSYANRAYRELTSAPGVIGQRLRDIFPSAITDGLEAELLRVLQTGEPYCFDHLSAARAEYPDAVWEAKASRIMQAGDTPFVVVCVRNITKAAATETRLREEVALLRAISDNSTDVIFAKDRTGRIRFANPATLALIGKPLDEVIGRTDAQFLGDKDAAHLVMENDRRIMDRAMAEEVEECVPLPDGSHRIWLSQKHPYKDQHDRVMGLLGISRDITERKHEEEKARMAHATLQRVLDSITDGLAILDRNWCCAYLSETGARLLNMRSEDILGKCLWDVFPHADKLMFGQKYRQAMAEGVAVHFEEYYPDPLNLWMECHCYPSAVGLSVYFHDVTARRRAEIAAQENEAKFRTIADAMPQMVWSTLPDGFHDYYNQQWYDFTGLDEGATDGDGWSTVFHQDDQALAWEAWRKSLATGLPYEIQYRLRHRSGAYRWTLGRALPVRDESGKIIRWMGTCTDIHDQKLIEEQLKMVNRRKDEFLAMLAHELRNPLAPISSAAQLLKIAGHDPKNVQRSGDIIGRQVAHMAALINDLLDVSRVTRGLVEIEQVPVDIKSVVWSAIEQAHPLLNQRHHLVSTSMSPLDAIVSGDRTRLVQVITNLLNNAAKYTPQGGQILVRVEVQGKQVSISVSDNGIGIPQTLMPHLFDLFTQGERTPDRNQGGLGLGLALVKNLIALHNGQIEVKSDGDGKGSTFTVTLPLAQQELPLRLQQPKPGEESSSRKLRIMIVDDNVDAAHMLAAVIKANGHQVMVKADSLSALADAEKLRTEVFVLDIGLPGMDGYELARRLRQLPGAADAVMIALTGYGQSHDKVLAKAAGFNHHFVKPANAEQLLNIFSTV